MNSIAGKLLVASPDLRDPNFAEAVVMMLEHSSDGALGVILNRPSATTIDGAWESLGEELPDNDTPVFLGGPVPGPLIALHATEEFGEKQVLPGVFMSVQRDTIERLVHVHDTRLRLFSGHSGWGGGQLEDELKMGGWHVARAEVEDVFGDQEETEELWKKVLKRMALNIMLPNVSPDDLPPDPMLN